MWNEEVALQPARVAEWVTGCLSDDGCVAWRKSQPELPQNSATALKTIVGKNFEQIVYDLTQDVFVYFGDEDLPDMASYYAAKLASASIVVSVTDESEGHSTGDAATDETTLEPVAVSITITPSLMRLIELAERLSSIKTLVVAHINTRKNGFPSSVRDQLPKLGALVLFPANTKEHFKVYDGDEESEEQLLEFIATTALYDLLKPS